MYARSMKGGGKMDAGTLAGIAAILFGTAAVIKSTTGLLSLFIKKKRKK